MAARLERHVHRRAGGARPGLLEGVHLGMRAAGALVMALADDDAVGVDEHGADHRVGRRRAVRARGVEQRATHHGDVVHHQARNSAWT